MDLAGSKWALSACQDLSRNLRTIGPHMADLSSTLILVRVCVGRQKKDESKYFVFSRRNLSFHPRKKKKRDWNARKEQKGSLDELNNDPLRRLLFSAAAWLLASLQWSSLGQ